MTKTTVKKEVHFARDIDEKLLRQIERVFKAAGETSIDVQFDNGYSVKCQSIDELMQLPPAESRPATRIWFRADEDRNVALAAARSPSTASLSITREIAFNSMSYELYGEFDYCAGMQSRLDDVLRSSFSSIRSVIHPRFFIDVVIAIFFLPALVDVYVLRPLGMHTSKDNYVLLQILVVLIYGAIKVLVLPRIKFKWGYGAKVEARRQWALSGLTSFFVLGAGGVIWQEKALQLWHSLVG